MKLPNFKKSVIAALLLLLVFSLMIIAVNTSNGAKKNARLYKNKAILTNTTPLPTSTPPPKQPTIEKPLVFGMVVNDYANRNGELSSLEQQLGKGIQSVSFYKQFGSRFNNMFNLDDLTYVKSSQKKIIVAWEPWNPKEGNNQSRNFLAEIASGTQDAYLLEFAQQVKQHQNPITIRFGHEMNGNWYPWGNRASEYKTAFRYIVEFFRKNNVTNVQWMWSINAENVPSSPISQVSSFYPGDDVVDLIGLDGYNFGPSLGYPWRSFTDIFSPSYTYVSSMYNKPLVISEVASAEIGGDKPLWVQQMLTQELPRQFPLISEVIWFNLLKETDWRINSSQTTLNSFITNLP